jgi:hypothetical protein
MMFRRYEAVRLERLKSYEAVYTNPNASEAERERASKAFWSWFDDEALHRGTLGAMCLSRF